MDMDKRSICAIIVLLLSFCFFASSSFAMGEKPPEVTPTTVSTMPSRITEAKDAIPPSEVEDLTIETIYEKGKKIRLTWKNPEDEDFEGVIIIVRTDRYPEDVKDYVGDGKLLVDLAGEPSTEQIYTHSLYYPPWMHVIVRDPDQYYLIVTYDKAGNYSRGLKGFVHGRIL